MKDDTCIFCKLAAGEIPSATIYEDQEFRVLLDLNPATRGHALILPKEHFMNILRCRRSGRRRHLRWQNGCQER